MLELLPVAQPDGNWPSPDQLAIFEQEKVSG